MDNASKLIMQYYNLIIYLILVISTAAVFALSLTAVLRKRAQYMLELIGSCLMFVQAAVGVIQLVGVYDMAIGFRTWFVLLGAILFSSGYCWRVYREIKKAKVAA